VDPFARSDEATPRCCDAANTLRVSIAYLIYNTLTGEFE
jgi:hypothetical protein